MRRKLNKILMASIVFFTILFMFLMFKSITDHREQIETIIRDSNKSTKILLCTTSIETDLKTQVEIDKCYPGGSQTEYFRLLDIPPSEL